MPAIVGSVALETPPAIALASPPPLKAITWKTSIIPVTVPSKPNNGASAIHVFINVVFLLIEDFASAKQENLKIHYVHVKDNIFSQISIPTLKEPKELLTKAHFHQLP